jgi:hypothetical protein
MSEFLDALGYFACGFVVGYFWYPLWELGKKIVSEAKKAKEQW